MKRRSFLTAAASLPLFAACGDVRLSLIHI